MNQVDFSVKPKQTVAIVGPTGAGKTTLVNLLMRFYELNKGKIDFDGRDITKLSRGELRRSFGMVLQNTWLFEGTVADNIAYGKMDATRNKLSKRLKSRNVITLFEHCQRDMIQSSLAKMVRYLKGSNNY